MDLTSVVLCEFSTMWKSLRKIKQGRTKKVKEFYKKCLRFGKKSCKLKLVDEHPHKQVKIKLK